MLIPLLVRCPHVLAGCLLVLGARAQSGPAGAVTTLAGAPVPYASVGVKGQAVGTVADEAGRFSLAALEPAGPADTVVITSVGYAPCRLPVGQLRTRPVVQLSPVPALLREVVVGHGRLRPAILGRNATGGSAHWTTTLRDVTDAADNRGWEVGTVLPVPRSCYVDDFHFYVEVNDFGPIRLRFKLYDVQRGQPAALLLNDDVQLTLLAGQTGWIDVDLRQQHLHLTKGQTVAASLQWLQGQPLQPTQKRFGGPGAFPSPRHRVLTRAKSEAPWHALPVHVSMYLGVQEYAE